jgi:hypothetical protein
MTKRELREFTSWLGKRSYRSRLERLGLERIQQIARENGNQSKGRPLKPWNKLSEAGKRARKRRARERKVSDDLQKRPVLHGEVHVAGRASLDFHGTQFT